MSIEQIIARSFYCGLAVASGVAALATGSIAVGWLATYLLFVAWYAGEAGGGRS